MLSFKGSTGRLQLRPAKKCHHRFQSRCVAVRATTKEPATKPAERTGLTIDPAYTNGAAYLKSIGIVNPAEVARVLDIAMNPNSLFLDYGGKRSRNASARLLDVEQDMKPVVDFLLSRGVSQGDIIKLISGHPPLLSYSVPDRLEPFWTYLESLGVKDVAAAVMNRPSLLGLDANAQVQKIVDYLKSVDTPTEQIIKMLLETI